MGKFVLALLAALLALAISCRPSDKAAGQNQSDNKKTRLATTTDNTVSELIADLKHRDDDIRADACRALTSLGPKARPALPALIDALGDRDWFVRCNAAQAIGAIGPEAVTAVPKLVKALRDQHESVRSWAAHSIGKIGPEAKSAIPALVALLKDKEPRVRAYAATSLGDIDRKPAVVVPALVAALKNEETPCRFFGGMAFYGGPDVKRTMATSLSRFGKDSVPALTDLLEHPSKEMRWCALYSLCEIGSSAKPAFDSIGKRLQDKDEVVGSLAVRALVNADPSPVRVIPLLMGALKSKSGSVRLAAAESLGEIGPKAGEATPLLIRVYNANDIEIGGSQWVVGEAIKSISPEAARRAGIK